MPAQVFTFDKPGALPAHVYLDTSFLLCVSHARQSSEPAGRRESSAEAFRQSLLAAGTTMWTSPLAVEEGAWWIMRETLFQEIDALGVKRHIGAFKRRPEYPAAYEKARRRVRPFLKDVQIALDVRLDPPSYAGAARVPGALILRRARYMIERYTLEAADAFHIAVAMLWGSPVASTDRDWQKVDRLVVYAYK